MLATVAEERTKYQPPRNINVASLNDVLAQFGRAVVSAKQLSFLVGPNSRREAVADLEFFYAGDLEILKGPCVAIIGTREVSAEGAARARRLARELASAGVTVISGLARGVDTHALAAAIESSGRVAAVIGTPLTKAYPAENASLQESIYRQHLLISQFPPGARVFKSNFPQRNRLMAALSDATVVIEASDTSGTLHQAAECARLGRWLFIAKSLIDDPNVTWPTKFLKAERSAVLSSTADVLGRLRP